MISNKESTWTISGTIDNTSMFAWKWNEEGELIAWNFWSKKYEKNFDSKIL